MEWWSRWRQIIFEAVSNNRKRHPVGWSHFSLLCLSDIVARQMEVRIAFYAHSRILKSSFYHTYMITNFPSWILKNSIPNLTQSVDFDQKLLPCSFVIKIKYETSAIELVHYLSSRIHLLFKPNSFLPLFFSNFFIISSTCWRPITHLYTKSIYIHISIFLLRRWSVDYLSIITKERYSCLDCIDKI